MIQKKKVNSVASSIALETKNKTLRAFVKGSFIIARTFSVYYEVKK